MAFDKFCEFYHSSMSHHMISQDHHASGPEGTQAGRSHSHAGVLEGGPESQPYAGVLEVAAWRRLSWTTVAFLWHSSSVQKFQYVPSDFQQSFKLQVQTRTRFKLVSKQLSDSLWLRRSHCDL
jgi:hypothetical protein